MSGAELRQASDGWHAVLRLEGVAHRLWLREIPAKGMPLVIELPLDADFELRSRAAHRFWSALEKRTLGKPPPTLPLQRRQRLTFAIRALDGRIEGNSYRAIAEVLFGKNRIPEGGGWKTHDLRTIRLVQTGLSLMRGGYHTLLRRRRKDRPSASHGHRNRGIED
jgi:hypothetical protein